MKYIYVFPYYAKLAEPVVHHFIVMATTEDAAQEVMLVIYDKDRSVIDFVLDESGHVKDQSRPQQRTQLAAADSRFYVFTDEPLGANHLRELDDTLRRIHTVIPSVKSVIYRQVYTTPYVRIAQFTSLQAAREQYDGNLDVYFSMQPDASGRAFYVNPFEQTNRSTYNSNDRLVSFVRFNDRFAYHRIAAHVHRDQSVDVFVNPPATRTRRSATEIYYELPPGFTLYTRSCAFCVLASDCNLIVWLFTPHQFIGEPRRKVRPYANAIETVNLSYDTELRIKQLFAENRFHRVEFKSNCIRAVDEQGNLMIVGNLDDEL